MKTKHNKFNPENSIEDSEGVRGKSLSSSSSPKKISQRQLARRRSRSRSNSPTKVNSCEILDPSPRENSRNNSRQSSVLSRQNNGGRSSLLKINVENRKSNGVVAGDLDDEEYETNGSSVSLDI